MRKRLFLVAVVTMLTLPSLIRAQTMLSTIETDKGEVRKPLVAHPLTWWTHDPLRRDVSGELMLGKARDDGRVIISRDYKVEQQIKPIGEISGHQIVQIRTSIEPAVVGDDLLVTRGEPAIWKELLVSSDQGHSFVEIYALKFDIDSQMPFNSASIHGSGPNAILGSWGPDGGNGGGCSDGYWWFDSSGPHAVDFSRLNAAIFKAIPKKATFTANCWALDPEHSRLRSVVQRVDAKCHACGILGEVEAAYRIEHGVARPVHVVFKPDPRPDLQ